ncbi:MAG: hypothetical protein LBH21_05850 [Gracilibacteraceae bacterium]|nr:hypothetical protein [Gracilibacteraceae bacterium]
MNKKIYGFQIQKETKWKNGLSENQLAEFQGIMGYEFPEILRDYYTVMNGVDMDQINVYGNSGLPCAYSKILYSFPDEVNIIKDLIQWIYAENAINEYEMKDRNISRIFPIYRHKFMLIDHDQHPVLSMYGNDIILYANSIIDLFNREFGKNKIKLNYNVNIKYWLD